MSTRFSRGIDIFNPVTFNKSVLIVGAGGIGSTTAYTLAKMGVSDITVWDGDTVEEHNCGSQFFSVKQIGKPKVEALAKNVKTMADAKIETINEFFDKNNEEHVKKLQEYGILILALDSLETRKDVIESSAVGQFIIDPRMERQLSIVNTLYGGEKNERKKNEMVELNSNGGEATRCTERAVAFNSMAMAGLIGSVFAKYAADKDYALTYQLDLENDILYTKKD